MSHHFHFYPFNYENCKEVDTTNFGIADHLKKTLGQTDPDWVVDDWVKNTVLGDEKTIFAFTLDYTIAMTGQREYSPGTKVVTRGKVSPFAIKSDKRLADLGERANPNDTLYITGHCVAGGNFLQSPDEKVKCSISDLIKYLQPLPKTWPGRMKINGCESASSGFWSGSSQPFAKQLHDELRTAGYECSIFGYTHTITAWPTPMEGSGGDMEMHKNTNGVRNSTYLQKIQ
jgi:hypothetical protein